MTNAESRIKFPPKYKIGQEVLVKVVTKHVASNSTFENEVDGIISEIKASSNGEKDTYLYGITKDLPACHHNGLLPFLEVYEDDIKLKKV